MIQKTVPNLKVFGARLKEAREFRRYETTTDLTKGIELNTGHYISPQTIDKIESGETDPTLSQLIAICQTLTGGLPFIPTPVGSDVHMVKECMEERDEDRS